MSRPSWDEYFMRLAHLTKERSTCNRRAVGCVLVRDRRILTTGYNGSLPDAPHCTDVGCLMHEGHCVRTVHAEANAIVQASIHGVNVKGATAYVTSCPCINCAKLLAAAGIVRIVYDDEYTTDLGIKLAEEVGVVVERFRPANGS